MPELPEVETVRRTLHPRVVGRSVVKVYRSKLALRGLPPGAAALRRALLAGPVVDVVRKGKYLAVLTRDAGVLFHLGMSGQLTVTQAHDAVAPHTHLRATFSDHTELRMVDPRRFGLCVPFVGRDHPPAWQALGPDPTVAGQLTAAVLARHLGATRRPIKQALLDQTVVAGLGNIYVAEVLFLAGVHPQRGADTLSPNDCARVFRCIGTVMRKAIANRGTSLNDYVDATGAKGSNQHHLWVYGRAGQACRRCGAGVELTVQSGRSTFHCPDCQPYRR